MMDELAKKRIDKLLSLSEGAVEYLETIPDNINAVLVLRNDNPELVMAISKNPGDLVTNAKSLLQAAAQFIAHSDVENPAELADWVRDTLYENIMHMREQRKEESQ